MRNVVSIVALCTLAVGLARPPQPPADADPVVLVRAYFAATNAGERAAAAARIASHPDYRPSRLSEWLHRGVQFPDLAAGVQALTVDVGGGQSRRVFLFIPDGYRADRSWPLLYVLHPSGQPADEYGLQMQQGIGKRAGEFVIASPEFQQNYIAARPPFVAEHPAMLDAVARRVHVAADRVHAIGYSKGGFGAWFVSLYYPDRIASAISMAAGFDVAPGDDGFWKLLAPNVAHVPVLNQWGQNDPLIVRDLADQPQMTFAESNRRFEREVRGMGLPITNIETPGGVHNFLSPPPASEVIRMLDARRPVDPKRVTHTFRHLHQASCYWLEGLSWVGESWGDPRPALLPARAGESESQTLARTLEPLLARLTGEIDGQTITVTRRHIGDLVVWLGERTVDWNKTVTLVVDGRPVFSGRVTRDVGVALARARATMDFDALRFAGLRVDASGRVTMVTADTMPDPAWRSGPRTPVEPRER